MRNLGRKNNELREISFHKNYMQYAEGSCLVKFGNTHVLCSATIEEKIPRFLKETGQGWITAEYGMLPRATQERTIREAFKGKQSGRTQEIQRLIGRTLRSITDLKALGERQIKIDCDVIQADGGTRTAAITGSYISLHLALQHLVKNRQIKSIPLTDHIAAISCGVINGNTYLDLDYFEDSNAEVDANFILTESGNIVELQLTAESSPFHINYFNKMFDLAHQGIKEIIKLQKNIISNDN